MFSIVGILLVFACVIIGFLMEKGKIAVLVQPAGKYRMRPSASR